MVWQYQRARHNYALWYHLTLVSGPRLSVRFGLKIITLFFLRVFKEFYQSHDNKFLLSGLYCSFLIERKLLDHSRERPKKTLREIISVKPPACFCGLSVRFPVAKGSLSRNIFTSVKEKAFLASKSSLFQLCL